MTNWEHLLRDWAKPANERQEARANRAAEEIRQALSAYQAVPNSVLKVAAQGSKLNNTDTVDDSDVDIRVELHLDRSQPEEIPPVFMHGETKMAKGLSESQLGLRTVELPITTETFKTHIERALIDEFGDDHVEHHDKCLKVKEQRLTFPADVVPCFPYRLYTSASTFEPGVVIISDTGERIVNFPNQHYKNGVAKNAATSTRFKKMVRCLKRMENELFRQGLLPQRLPSFFIESLVYNCHDGLFNYDSYVSMFASVTFGIYRYLHDANTHPYLMEVNGVKSLFYDGQSWTVEQGEMLAALAWHRVAKDSGLA